MANLKRDALKAIKSDGGSTSYYKLPEGATELNDLIEHKKMSFALGNCFKACYRLGEKEGADLLYDLNKIVFFANRMIDQEKKQMRPTIRYATKEEQRAAIERVLAKHDLSDPRWDDDYKDLKPDPDLDLFAYWDESQMYLDDPDRKPFTRGKRKGIVISQVQMRAPWKGSTEMRADLNERINLAKEKNDKGY